MPRSPFAGLRHVLRTSSAGDGLLPQFVADNLEAIAAVLNVDAGRLSALDLEQPEARGRLSAAATAAEKQRVASRSHDADRRRHERGRDLVMASRWMGDKLELPPSELFAFAASAIAPVLCFETGSFSVHVQRALLGRARTALSRLPDSAAFLDEHALHLRWRGGRGGLDLRCPPPAPRDQPAFPVRFESPRAARPPVLLAEVLSDLGLTA